MKKIILSFAVAAAMLSANAQDMMSKKGFPILPEAGDWSIGFDVNSVMQDFGNVIHTTNSPNDISQGQPGSLFNQTLIGLYVVDPQTAYRAKLRIGFGSHDVTQSGAGYTSFDSLNVPSETKVSNMNITLGFGIQKSRGKGRLHGIYGVELDVLIGGASDTTFTYLKPITATSVGSQVSEDKTGSSFGIGLNGFLGAEYFFAPKMSVSAEYWWGLNLNSVSAGTESVVSSNGTTVTSASYTGAKSSNFALDVTNSTQIVLHLYF